MKVNTNPNLYNLIKQIDQNYATANVDLSEWPSNTRLGMEAAKRFARTEYERLLQEYAKEFHKTVAKIFVKNNVEIGDKIRALLVEEGAITVPADSIYKAMAARIEPMVGADRQFGSAAYARLLETVSEHARHYRVTPHSMLVEPIGVYVPDFQSLTDVVRDTVRAAFGDALNKAYITDVVTYKAIQDKISNNLTIIVFSGLTESEQSALMESVFSGQPAFGVELKENEEPDKSFILTLYQRVKDSLGIKFKAPAVTVPTDNVDGMTVEKMAKMQKRNQKDK